jgi:hypothetical protein
VGTGSHLNFFDCDVTGPIPAGIGNLAALT